MNRRNRKSDAPPIQFLLDWYNRVDLWRLGCTERAAYIANSANYRVVYTFTLPSGNCYGIEARTLSQMDK